MNKSYQNDDLGITLEMPFTWQATHNEQIPLVLIAPIEKGFRANMSLVLTSLDEALQTQPETEGEEAAEAVAVTLEALAVVRDSAREDRRAAYADYALVSEEEYAQDGLTGFIEHFRWTTEDTKKPITQLFALLLNEYDEMVSIHGTCLTKLEDKYLPRFREVIASLRFLEDEDGEEG